ncbi:hypothetical protein ACFPAF_09740 [Hymenobacter endophyticus]|uniref:Prolyl-tRNA synthetase n=1 Tax=Hymenobacter endophyticus TaxID=3076335 RepID=A0ABU3TH48_9BACT|nr:hypothetical protein [Hymenobacter endophyticus]MDU0370673.1 hypothetical protein [Hymenobacter endophyticus]
MKKILSPLLPALALLTLGGCASSSYLATTENDGMYYSSSDRVTVPAQAATAAAPASEEATTVEPGDVTNPDYDGTVGRSSATGSGEYYDDDYYYASRLRRFHSPYRGIGMGYYDFAYTDPYWYGGGAAYSPWGYGYNGLYDPFFSPWGYGSVNINIGFGRPWYRPWRGGYGYSPYDYGFGSPWGGYGFGSPWGGYGGGYYPGLYGGGYGGGFYGGGGYYGGNGWGNYYERPGQRATYGPRRDRATDGQRLAAPNTNVPASSGRGRVQEGGFTGGGTPGSTTSGVAGRPEGSGRRRVQEITDTNTPPVSSPQPSTRRVREAQVSQAEQVPLPSPQAEQIPGGRRWRTLDNTTNGTVSSPNGAGTQSSSGEQTRRRRVEWNPAGGTTGSEQQPAQPRVADQPRRQRLYDQSSQPSQPRRTYSEPARTYEQPSRSYEQPSRSYSEPSRSSSSGNSGGGGSDGGGRRGRVQ